MADISSYPSAVARRYGGSLFDLAQEAGCVAAVERELDAFVSDVNKNPDLQRLIRSPVFSAKEQLAVVGEMAKKSGLEGTGARGLVGNFLKTIATNRRLFMLGSIIDAFRALSAEARGEIVAEVTSAHALTAAQEKELKAVLGEVTGKSVQLRLGIDGALLGGLVVRIGSRQLDTSLRSKLSSLKTALKEVG